MVVCQEDNKNEYYKNAPVIIVEVLSKSTRRFDQTDKLLRCQRIPSLEEYVLIEQDKGEIQVISKKDQWQSFYYYLGDEITFSSLCVTVLVEDIYYQVNNDDVLDFCRKKVRSAFYAPIVMTTKLCAQRTLPLT
jgi:Uma2 family endonuclease